MNIDAKKQVDDMNSYYKMLELESGISRGASSTLSSTRYLGRLRKTGTKTSGTLSPRETMTVIGMLVLGGAMQAIANGAIEALLVMLFYFLVGRMAVSLVFQNRKPELRAFFLMYAICIFAGGLAQIYSFAVFNQIQTTTDARGFFRQISPQPPFITFETVPYFGTSLALVIWQQFYKLTWWLGFKFGPYTGVMVNALVMGLVASLTVQIARELFGDNAGRLRRVGTLVAANGLFILFGAVLLRDSFTTFFMTLALWSGVRFLVRLNIQSFVIAIVVTAISAWTMQYLREGAYLLIFLYGILALLFGLLKRLGVVGITVVSLFLIAVFAGGSFFSTYLYEIQTNQTYYLEKYTNWATRTEAADSLGMQFLYNQPLPIRLSTGSVTLMLSPIPLWAFFNLDSSDYHWIKGYNGIYQFFVMPLVFAGFLAAFRIFFRDIKRSWPFMFLVIFLLINAAGVVASSLEQRHFGQFMSAFVVIAAIPDTRDEKANNELRNIRVWWFFAVLLVHILWAVLKIAQ